MANHLKDQLSPYLLQHAETPVDWYPWGKEAFDRAASEDKPVFLSIGYSTCHWCHVMAHESFEDAEIAEILNANFIAIKVDKEERPDVDSAYMAVCQAFTGSGGWPMSIFLTPERRPFFAGTYFPKHSRNGYPGFAELLLAVSDKWENDRESLLASADALTDAVNRPHVSPAQADETLPAQGKAQYARSFDRAYSGFGDAPKFPSPQNLLFLLHYAEKHGESEAAEMAEKTLMQLRRGGIFDQIGYGFSRYSTDRYFLVPHFEKMLCDNAMLILTYCRAYAQTGETLFRQTAEETAAFLFASMRSPDGAYYSAHDADSGGEEGGYYVFTPDEVKSVLGEKDGAAFCAYFDITENGNFAGKSIPNLLPDKALTDRFDVFLPALRKFRARRTALHTDDKILTAWNALTIAALCALCRVSANSRYLEAARRTLRFLDEKLCVGDTLYVSFRMEQRSEKGFLDEYACFIFALLALYDVTLDREYLTRAADMTDKAVRDFFDAENGGFYLSGRENEALPFRLKACFDGAMPSGNSLMAWNLVRLSRLMPDEAREKVLEKQLGYLAGEAKAYPAGHAMYLMALDERLSPSETVTVVRRTADEDLSALISVLSPDSTVLVEDASSGGHPLLNGETAVYVCRDYTCLPPVTLREFLEARQNNPAEAENAVL